MSGSSECFYDPIQPELLYLHSVTTYKLETIYHRHNAYEIYLFLRGNVHFYVENRCYHVQPGDLLVMSPEEMHRAFILDESEYERITINLKKHIYFSFPHHQPIYRHVLIIAPKEQATSYI